MKFRFQWATHSRALGLLSSQFTKFRNRGMKLTSWRLFGIPTHPFTLLNPAMLRNSILSLLETRVSLSWPLWVTLWTLKVYWQSPKSTIRKYWGLLSAFELIYKFYNISPRRTPQLLSSSESARLEERGRIVFRRNVRDWWMTLSIEVRLVFPGS